MPFTLSHPAVVLPLRGTGLPMAALVCGSMAPDLHMLVPGVTDTMTHRWQGVPTIDVVLGYALTAFWVIVLAPTVTAAAPDAARARLRPPPQYRARDWLLALPGVLVGAVTHVGWDTFTHQDMWGGQHVPWLYHVHHGHPGFQLAQYGSSVAGLAIIGLWAWATAGRRRPRPIPADPRSALARRCVVGPVAVGVVLSFLPSGWLILLGHREVDFLLYLVARTWLVASGLLLVVAATGWRIVTATDGRHPETAR